MHCIVMNRTNKSQNNRIPDFNNNNCTDDECRKQTCYFLVRGPSAIILLLIVNNITTHNLTSFHISSVSYFIVLGMELG